MSLMNTHPIKGTVSWLLDVDVWVFKIRWLLHRHTCAGKTLHQFIYTLRNETPPSRAWLVTRRDEMGEGVWGWREKGHVNQEPRRSCSCWWSWLHGNTDVSGLRDSFCRWIKQNQRFSGVDCWQQTGVSVRKWDVQATGSGRRSNVQILVDLNTPHLCAVGGESLCKDIHMVGSCIYRMHSGRNHFKLNVQDGLQDLWLNHALHLIPGEGSLCGLYELYLPESCGSCLLLKISL